MSSRYDSSLFAETTLPKQDYFARILATVLPLLPFWWVISAAILTPALLLSALLA